MAVAHQWWGWSQQAECTTVTNKEEGLEMKWKKGGVRENVRASVDQGPTSFSICCKRKYFDPTCRYVRWEIHEISTRSVAALSVFIQEKFVHFLY